MNDNSNVHGRLHPTVSPAIVVTEEMITDMGKMGDPGQLREWGRQGDGYGLPLGIRFVRLVNGVSWRWRVYMCW
jgi:hypothetical protein